MIVWDDEGQEIQLPTHREVCPRCDGLGKHVNPAIDGNGLTRDDIDNLGGDEFLDDYLGGMYDVTCEECKGRNVVEVVSEDELTPEQRKAWEIFCDIQRDLEFERKMMERGIEW